MCGIIGYIGERNKAQNLILEGLKTLEYRGYDSWGIAVKDKGTLVAEKHVGKIGHAKTTLPDTSMGIGHTRWATHGGVTEANSHPHLDCTQQIAVVHNGIIENYETLKKELMKKGHTFLSGTDTEVIPHLIEENLKKHSFPDAVRISFNSLHGLSAIVVLDTKSNTLIAAKNGSPLVIGVGKNEFFVASDATGIIPHTKKVIFLEDNQMIILGREITLLKLPTGDKIQPKIEVLDWEFKKAE
jgi:glucosamine--fructose-6-phosphate aminotransferase (isomerizing)